ncbi:MAG: 2Fe-2S iron-sulfur cluster-binding protein [Cyclobacteriaceae bacterium]|nr:2Fe-2S iron-sulfur cluster binding domain-containing protein [Cyclobacteriaceae bacterium]MCB0487154.1 2Fe-2S iron-sulfur cluster binding domain-containing protein [Cyclobacteriaceae bacterium]
MKIRREFDISFTVFLQTEKHTIVTYQGEYRNLMALLYDKFYIEDFGECKGIGRCGTCHIHILNSVDLILSKAKAGNENTTLGKMNCVQWNSRLACQIIIDKNLDGVQIEFETI